MLQPQEHESTYQALLPFAAQPAGFDSLIPLWPAAQILGDIARYLSRPEAEGHYRHALAIAEKAHVQLWRDAATKRLRETAPGHSSHRANPSTASRAVA